MLWDFFRGTEIPKGTQKLLKRNQSWVHQEANHFTPCHIHLVDIKAGENVCYNILDKIKYFNLLILCCSDIKLLI